MDILSIISNFLISGFILTIILLLSAYWIFSLHRQTLRKLITLSHIYLIIGSSIFLVLSILQISSDSFSNNELEKYAVINRMLGPNWLVYLGPTLFKGFIPQILWIKKIRQSILTSIIMMPFLLVDFYIRLFNSRQEYLLSTSRINPDISDIFSQIVIFGTLLTTTYILTKKTNIINT